MGNLLVQRLASSKGNYAAFPNPDAAGTSPGTSRVHSGATPVARSTNFLRLKNFPKRLVALPRRLPG